MAPWRFPPSESKLWGQGWIAEREAGQAIVSTPTGKWDQGELTFPISDADFELLRADPGKFEEVFRRYNWIMGDGWTVQRDDKCVVYLDKARFGDDNARFVIPQAKFDALKGDPGLFDEIYREFRHDRI